MKREFLPTKQSIKPITKTHVAGIRNIPSGHISVHGKYRSLLIRIIGGLEEAIAFHV